MADESQMNGEVFEDQKVTITGDEVSDYELKIGELSDDLSALEKEKNLVVEENKSLNDTVRKVKESVESLSSEKERLSAENEGLKAEVEKLAAENKSLNTVAARAFDLEGDVARTQHELITTMSALQEANQEISLLKSKLGVFEGGESEIAKKLESVATERDLLLSKVAQLESTIEELNVDVIARDALVKKVKEMEGKLVENEKLISSLESESDQVLANGVKDRESSSSEGNEGSVLGGVKMDWPVVAAVSTVGSVAVLGSIYYLQYSKRN